ncbi:MAG: hypothetical protein A3F93_01290 [Candidatus Magasanikbacteria bacterium RIFCSPLOWO2_12_FULL_34_7]|nr:MAG: hypothetical protein A3F93_01290 [Candidatus Magasanikbacteria bacterium RIFCSPLOWO2_12_FULL_34_7]
MGVGVGVGAGTVQSVIYTLGSVLVLTPLKLWAYLIILDIWVIAEFPFLLTVSIVFVLLVPRKAEKSTLTIKTPTEKITKITTKSSIKVNPSDLRIMNNELRIMDFVLIFLFLILNSCFIILSRAVK